MQTRLFGTLRSRIFAALFAISLVPIAVLGIQGYHCAMQAVSELAHKHLAAMADSRASEVTTWLQERTRSLQTLASLPATLTADSLDSFQAINADFRVIALYDAQWNLVALTKGASESEALADPEFRSNVEKADASFLRALDSHGDETELALGCPVGSANGKASGFLVATLDFAGSLTPLLQDPEGLYTSGKMFLVSNHGQVLTQPSPGEQMAVWKPGNSHSAGHHVGDATAGVTTYEDHRGHVVLGTTIPVGVDGWQLVAEIDRDEAMGWLRILLIRAAVTGLVTCVLVVGIAAWISNLVGKPLRELMRVAFRIRGGHTDERVEKMDVVEAEEVRQAFNAMLDELREKQDELVKSATLAYVGELTSSTVHEMRNPLSSIKMNLQALSRCVDQNGKYKELGEIALEQTRRLEQMLTDLLNFGKPVKLAMETLPFLELANATVQVTAETAHRNHVEVEVENRLNGLLLRVDKEQMCRAMTNLVGNAIEAMPSGGRVTVTAEELSGEVELSVQDTGPGLLDEAMQRALQPFYTTKRNGTGLGLPNVKKIVELHGGRLLMENCPEGGARFRVILPLKCLARA